MMVEAIKVLGALFVVKLFLIAEFSVSFAGWLLSSAVVILSIAVKNLSL